MNKSVHVILCIISSPISFRRQFSYEAVQKNIHSCFATNNSGFQS